MQNKMEIKGKVIELGQREAKTANSGKEYFVQNMVIETQDQYPKKIAIEVGRIKEDNIKYIKVGSVVTASINVESREYKGKWYTTVSAWKCFTESGGASPETKKASQMPNNSYPVEEDDNTDLPF